MIELRASDFGNSISEPVALQAVADSGSGIPRIHPNLSSHGNEFAPQAPILRKSSITEPNDLFGSNTETPWDQDSAFQFSQVVAQDSRIASSTDPGKQHLGDNIVPLL